MTLRDQLVAAELTGRAFVAEDGYTSVKFLSNDEAAGRALTVFREWLESEADELRARAFERLDEGDPDADRHYRRFLAQAVALEDRARSLAAALDRKDPTP